uniref:Uncharacterized protein n=1 Tax=Strigamia maritima TaxID=126957 RepID=T1JBU0_STRMM
MGFYNTRFRWKRYFSSLFRIAQYYSAISR